MATTEKCIVITRLCESLHCGVLRSTWVLRLLFGGQGYMSKNISRQIFLSSRKVKLSWKIKVKTIQCQHCFKVKQQHSIFLLLWSMCFVDGATYGKGLIKAMFLLLNDRWVKKRYESECLCIRIRFWMVSEDHPHQYIKYFDLVDGLGRPFESIQMARLMNRLMVIRDLSGSTITKY